MKIDAIQTANAPTLSVGRRSHSLFAVPAVAAVGLTTVWASGLAAIALTIVLVALGRAARRRKTDRLGLAAAALSAVERALGLLLAGFVSPDRGTKRAGRLFGLINRLDGVKMFALAALAVAGVALARTSWSLKAAT